MTTRLRSFASHSTAAKALHFAFGCALLIGGAGQAGAVTYDVAADFSSANNTNSSTWSYRYDEDLVQDASYALLDTSVIGGPGWTPSSPDYWTLGGNLPAVFSNQSAQVINFTLGAPISMLPGQFGMHPSLTQLVVVSWLSPVSTVYQIAYSFADLDPNGGDGIAWAVELSTGVTTLASGSFINGGTSGALNIAPMFIAAGERINFIVAPRDNELFDSTALTAVITVVPEPAHIGTALASGVALIGLLRRRRS